MSGLFESMASGMLGGLGGGLLSGGFGALGSIFSNKAQKKENQRNRDFTEYMYDKQYDNNIKMWNMQNKYDLPSAQKQRLIDAGLNPDLMYSGKGVSPSPNLQAAVAGSASSGSLPGYGGIAEAFNQGRLLDAQIRNIDADTKKKESETVGQGYQNDILKTDASFEAALKSGEVNVLGVQVALGNSNIEINKETIPKIRQEVINLQKSVEVMNQNITESAQRVANMKLDEVSKLLDNVLKEQSMNYQLRILAANCHISEVEAKYAIAKICSDLAVNVSRVNANNASANASNASARLTNLHWNIGQMEYNLRCAGGYYNLVVDSDVEELRSSIANSIRNQKRDDLIAGNHFFGNYIWPAVDAATNLVGGVFGASVSYSKSAPKVAIGPYDSPNFPSY